MTCSMTGFGRSAGELGGEQITVELSAVNHRFLDCSFRLPNAWAILEPELRNTVKRYLARGRLTIAVRRDRGPQGRTQVQCDVEVAKEYMAAAKQLSGLMSSTEALSLNVLLQLEGVFYQEEEEQDLELVHDRLDSLIVEALEQLNAVRSSEGAALALDCMERLDQMREGLGLVEARLPEITESYALRLRERITELLKDTTIAEDRITLEVAMMADKSDVNEELVRFKSHLDHAAVMLQSDGPVGRELGFLTQEMQREVNTLGSKLRDVGIAREVIRIKSELEKLKEQILNIE